MKWISKNKAMRRYDVAYACFLCLGTIFVLSYIFALLMPEELLIMLVMIFALPIIIVSFLAAVLGVILSIKLWREWQLSLLSLLTIAVPVIAWLTEFNPRSQFVADWYVVPYSILALAISLIWFLSRRKRLMDKNNWPNQENPADAKTQRD